MTSSKGEGERFRPLPTFLTNPNFELYKGGNYVVLDFETTNTDRGSPLTSENNIILARWRLGPSHPEGGRDSRGTNCTYEQLGNEYTMDRLLRHIEQASFIVAHNAKFECGWLRRCGVRLRSLLVYDTQIAEHVIGGNSFSPRELGLSAVANRRGIGTKDDVVSWMIKQGWPPENVPLRWLSEYCAVDVALTEQVMLDQFENLDRLNLWPVLYARCVLTPCLADIEFNGMQLDAEKVLTLTQEVERERNSTELELIQLCEGILPTQRAQLAKFVFDTLGFSVPKDYRGRPLLTNKGSYSVAAEVVGKLEARTDRQKEFLRLYTKWLSCETRISKYLDKFRSCVEEDAGRIFASFNQCFTRTHRLSSTGLRWRIQLHNLARVLKYLFCARDSDRVIGEADGSQLEFRAATHLGRDAVALQYIIDDGADIHIYTASVLNDISENLVTPEQRQAAKEDTFKPLFGGSSGTPEQQRYYEAFKEKYRGIAQTQQQWVDDVLQQKFLVTEWGLRFYFPDTKQEPSGYIINTTNIYNYPVQSFATAEIIPLTLVALWHRVEDTDIHIINTVHDSAIADLPKKDIPLWHELARQCFCLDAYHLIKAMYNIDITVPLGVGVMTSTNWSDKAAKESEVSYEPDDSMWKFAAIKEGMI